MTLVSSLLLFAALVDSPLPNASHYVYTQLSNRAHMISGKLMGTNPKGHPPLRGEDILYLNEALSEIGYYYTYASPIYQMYSRVITRPSAGVDLLDTLKYQPVKSRLYIDKDIEGASNLIAYGKQSETDAICTYATDAVVKSNAEPVFDPACSNLYANIIFSSRRPPKVDDVAGLYRTLKAIKGVAYDMMASPTNTKQVVMTGTVEQLDAQWDSTNEDWAYKTITGDTAWWDTPPASYFAVQNRSTMKQQSVTDDGGKTHVVRTRELTFKSEIDGFVDGTLRVRLMPHPDDRIAYLHPSGKYTVRKCWIAYELTAYMSTYTEQLDSKGERTSANEIASTNVYAVIEIPKANVSFESQSWEYNAPVTYAYIGTDVNSAYMRLFGLLPASLKLYDSVPQVSAKDFGGYEGSTIVGNSRTSTYKVRPYSVSILVDIDWHTGFHNME